MSLVWQAKHLYPLTDEQLENLGEWEPVGSTPQGGLLLKRQFFTESDEAKSSTRSPDTEPWPGQERL
jgi:hypothetical protein